MKELSDKELDLAIELLVNPEFQQAWDKKGHNKYWVDECLPRYTESWELLMHLVAEYMSELVYLPCTNTWADTESIGIDVHTITKSPQRALAECLLKVLQGEQANE